jgi:uncharacterized protein YdhG (YjbR/CyaY superfamily)
VIAGVISSYPQIFDKKRFPMPTKTTAKTPSKKPAKAATKGGMSAAEKLAIKERAAELKAQALGLKGEAEVEAKWKLMKPENRAVAKALHKLIKDVDPGIESKTWYSMPAYYKNGKLICFFQSADKWDTRYSTLGFDANAKLDDGSMWPTSFALTKLTPANSKAIAALVKKAIGKK